MHKGVKAYAKGFLSNHLPILLIDLLVILVVFKFVPQLSLLWIGNDPLVQAITSGVATQAPDLQSTELLALLGKYIFALCMFAITLFFGIVVQQGTAWQWIQKKKLTFDYKKYSIHTLMWIVVAVLPYSLIFILLATGTRVVSLAVSSEIFYTVVTLFMWTLVILGIHLSFWFFYKTGKGAVQRMLSKDAFVSYYVTFAISVSLFISFALINHAASLLPPGIFNLIFLINTYITGLMLLSWMRYSIYYYQKEK